MTPEEPDLFARETWQFYQYILNKPIQTKKANMHNLKFSSFISFFALIKPSRKAIWGLPAANMQYH